MAFYDEIITALDIDQKTKTGGFIYLSPENGLVCEGYKKLLSLSVAKIVLQLSSGSRLLITGKNLSVKEISTSEISLLGQVESLTIERVKK